MKGTSIRQAVVWLGLVAACWGAIKYWPDALRLVRGNDCLAEFVVPDIGPATLALTGRDQQTTWVLSGGKLYLAAESGVYEICATGDPRQPILTGELR